MQLYRSRFYRSHLTGHNERTAGATVSPALYPFARAAEGFWATTLQRYHPVEDSILLNLAARPLFKRWSDAVQATVYDSGVGLYFHFLAISSSVNLLVFVLSIASTSA